MLTRAQAKEYDRLATEELGIPSLLLMENAGRQAANAVLDVLEVEMHLMPNDANVAIVCGGGNNGGDGYAIARHLHNAGVAAIAFAASDPAKRPPDAAAQHHIAEKMGLVHPLGDRPDSLLSGEVFEQAGASRRDIHIIVDALLGIGFTGQLRDDAARIIDMINKGREVGVKVVAIDLPSGLDADTGQPAHPTVQADVTVTFITEKAGFQNEQAQNHLGEVVTADIGAPLWLTERLTT